MRKLSLVGQDVSGFVDCSDVIPESERVWANKVGKDGLRRRDDGSDEPDSGPHLPAGKTMDDIEHTCPDPFPVLTAQPGLVTSVNPAEP